MLSLLQHGRLKVRTSAEEAARKKKEQDLKVKAYRAAMGRIQQKRSSQEMDQEMMTLSGQILGRNPDVFTLWNIRKECLMELTLSLEEGEYVLSILGELLTRYLFFQRKAGSVR